MANLEPPNYGPPPSAQHQTVVIQAPVVGPHPQALQCPSCRATVTTRVVVEASTKTHTIAAILCCVSCCCCLPYCIDSCQNRNHYCPNCNAFIGKH